MFLRKKILRNLIVGGLLIASPFTSHAYNTDSSNAAATLLFPALVNEFYQLNRQQEFWASKPELKKSFITLIDTLDRLGLDKRKYHYTELKTTGYLSGINIDRLFTDACFSILIDLHHGTNIGDWIMNDEVSPKHPGHYADHLAKDLADVKTPRDLGVIISSTEPQSNDYLCLKRELINQINAGNQKKAAQLATALNFHRWITNFGFDKYITVNIPSATLRYIKSDSVKLQMKVVVGKPSTRTPRFSTWCNEIILYPYWNVPRSIAVKELLPKFRRSPAAIDALNMQVINSSGKVVNHYAINWKNVSSSNLNYTFRQCTGCDNSLGVIKFNLTDPFGVYMHDTNFKRAFASKSRFLSHGCIRLEKPAELGNYLAPNKLDTNFINACVIGQKPITIALDKPVPVFVIYTTADVSGDTVVFYNDIYRLYK